MSVPRWTFPVLALGVLAAAFAFVKRTPCDSFRGRARRSRLDPAGHDQNAASDGEINLHMEFDRGEAVYASVSAGSKDAVRDGEPVGGGPKLRSD